jgi:predicted transcriptional regulator
MDNAKKDIKRFILKSYMDTDREILPGGWIADLIKKMNMYEKEFFSRAIEELIQAGILEQVKGKGLPSGLKLTRKGECLIYNS